MPKCRSYMIFVKDIVDAITKIESYIKDLDYNTFAQNSMIIDAVIRNLEIIGEATKNIPDDVKKRYQGIPWKRMIGLRNIVIHEYFGVDLDNIWKIINENIPAVKPDILKILDELEAEEKKS